MYKEQEHLTLNNKRTQGQYFTKYNPFENEGFLEWAEKCNLKEQTILEPFAGANNLIDMLKKMELCNDFISFDIEPKNNEVQYKNTLIDFPKSYNVCITNPPYLAQNSATRRGLFYPKTKYDDLYKYALELCLKNCNYVAAIIPASFLNAELFRNRLSYYILLNTKMFDDTDCPVCLALFEKKSDDVKVYDEHYIGLLSELEKKIPQGENIEMRFNSPTGSLGLIAIDNTIEPSIRFIEGDKIPASRISVSSRSITRINIGCSLILLIDKLNDRLAQFREDTNDIFLTPFKGLRKDNKYRRRLDYALARKLISEVAYWN
ncbi:MAG: hypothetical protein FWG85_06985 [Bacteroidetes bacterium]|nr:hypothetical protein [Bacteroidota bacterium]